MKTSTARSLRHRRIRLASSHRAEITIEHARRKSARAGYWQLGPMPLPSPSAPAAAARGFQDGMTCQLLLLLLPGGLGE